MPEIKSNRAWRLECEALRQQSTELKAEIQTIRNSPTMDTIRQIIQSKLAEENDQLREQLGTTEDHLRRVEQAFESTNAKLREQVTLLRILVKRSTEYRSAVPEYEAGLAATEQKGNQNETVLSRNT